MTQRVLLALGLTALLVSVAFGWRGALEPSIPATFERQFTATGLVERISPGKQGSCIVRVAVYDWIRLSGGFDLGDVPQESDRYDVTGSGAACQSLSVSMASSSNHISFTLGQVGNTWYFAAPPAPALGCGGLEIDWTPTPL